MKPFVIATVINAKGSTPRENGAQLLISATEILGTIGGGKLEYQVINEARILLANHENTPVNSQQNYILGTQLGQCCGGQLAIDFHMTTDVGLWRDPLAENQQQFNIVLFGAGHVGQAIINILASQPCQVHWVDSRAEIFPPNMPDNVVKYLSDDPASLVADMPDNSYYLIMTHDHGLDLELCDHVLSRGGFQFLGLIGSQTKAVRFKRQLLRRGLEQQDVERITCPIGIEGIRGKLPSSIALGVVAQLVGLEENFKDSPICLPSSLVEGVTKDKSPPSPLSTVYKTKRSNQREVPFELNQGFIEEPPPLKKGERGGFKALTTPPTNELNRSQNETHP